MGKMVRRAPGEATWMRSPLYEEIAKVPLLIHVPGAKPGRTSKLACALDLAPTICDMAGLPRQAEMQGLSLLPGVLGQAFEGRDHVLTALPLANPGDTVEVVDDLMRTVVEWQPVTITTQKWSLLYATPSEPVELYDLRVRPEANDQRGGKAPRRHPFSAGDVCGGPAPRRSHQEIHRSSPRRPCSNAHPRSSRLRKYRSTGGGRHEGRLHAKAIPRLHRDGARCPRILAPDAIDSGGG